VPLHVLIYRKLSLVFLHKLCGPLQRWVLRSSGLSMILVIMVVSQYRAFTPSCGVSLWVEVKPRARWSVSLGKHGLR